MKANDLGLLILRLAVGAVFIAHGAQKFFGPAGIQAFADSLAAMNVPSPTAMAYLSAGWELGGGIALVLGFLTRLAALGLAVTMAVAVFLVHLGGGFFAPKGFEYPMTLGCACLALVCLGAGKLSVDGGLLFRGKKGH